MVFNFLRRASMKIPHGRKISSHRWCNYLPQLENLEGRVLPSTSIPINSSTWTSLGPGPVLNGQTPGSQPTTGRITSLVADPSDATGNTIYVTGAGGGVWKTINGGSNWTPLTDNQATLLMSSIALLPSNPKIIYAGTGEGYYGRGVLKSTDAGTSWTLLTGNAGKNEFDRRVVSKVVIDPTDSTGSTVYIATTTFAFSTLGGNTAIWKTTNGGISWTDTTTGKIGGTSGIDDYSDLVIDPSNHLHLYAALGTPYSTFNQDNAVYETKDGGTTWSVSGNFPKGVTNEGTIALAISAATPKSLYAFVVDASDGGVYRLYKTTDGGTTWAGVPTAPPNYLGSIGYYITLAVDPSNANIVYLGGESDKFNIGSAIFQSTDGGTSWNDISNTSPLGTNGPHADHHAIGFDAKGKLLVGTDGGLWRLDNSAPGSIHWSDLNGNLQLIQFYGVALDPTNLNIAYGGSQDNGTDKFNDSTSWTEVAYGDGGFARVDRNNPSTVYQTYNFGPTFFQRSDDGGASFSTKVTGINTSDQANFIVPYVLDPSNPQRLVLGTDHVYESTNRADNWSVIATPGTNGFTTNGSVIDSVAVAPSAPNTIYVSAGGHLFVTFNDGASWTKIDIPNVSDYFPTIVVDSSSDRTAYVTRDVFNFGTAVGHVFMTTNGGTSWTDITGNLPEMPTRALAVDPRTSPHTLYVGNDQNVYVSTNLGVSWSVFKTGLPNAHVRELELNTSLNVLAAATLGRGLWEISLGPRASNTALTTGPSPSVFGQSITLTATVNTSITGAGVPTGSVTFREGSTTLGTAPMSGGIAMLSLTSLGVGSHAITAVYGGDSNFVTSTSTVVTQVVTKDATKTVVTLVPSPIVVGQSFTLTATVTANAPGAGTPTGNVTFFQSGSILFGGPQTLDSKGQASVIASSAVAGSNSITATYNGDGNFLTGNSAPVALTIGKDATTTTVTASPNPGVAGQSIKLTAAVVANAPGSGIPTGTVTFFSGTTTLFGGPQPLDSSGKFSANLVTPAAGSNSITATYNGDSNYLASTSAIVAVTTNKDATTTVMVASPNPIVFGQTTTLTATVAAKPPGAGSPTGQVTFFDGANALPNGTVSLNGAGQAVLSIASLSAGNHTLTATYQGDANFLTSTSAVVSFTVNQAATTTQLNVSPNPAGLGQTVTLTATVAANAPGSSNPGGTVTFFDGSLALAGSTQTLNSLGSAVFAISSLAVGSHSISAHYNGNSNGLPSISSTTTLTVKSASTIVASVSRNPAIAGETITLSAMVTASGTPTGAVTFMDGAATLGSGTLMNGQVSVLTATLTAGSHSISAVYSGDSNFGPSTSATLTEVINDQVFAQLGLFDQAASVFTLKNTDIFGGSDQAFNYGPTASGFLPLYGDWTSSGKDTAGLYNPVKGNFLLKNTNSSGVADVKFGFGPAGLGWMPLAGDWTGQGEDTVGLYDPASSTFFLRNSNAGGNADIVFTFGPGNSGFQPIVGDWDGNGTTTIGLYNPLSSTFFLKNSNSAGPAELTFTYGSAGGLIPLGGDWTGQGKDTVGLFNPQKGRFLLKNSNTSGNADLVLNYGSTNAVPFAGDGRLARISNLGLFNPSSSVFSLSNANTSGPISTSFNFGPPAANWTPISGDWTNSGTTTIGLFDPTSSTFFLKNSNSSGAADATFSFGPPNVGWLPVIGHWSSPGNDTVGLFNPAQSRFFLKNANSSGPADANFNFGPSGLGWMPIAGDWTGSGITTIGLYDPATSTFYLKNSNAAGPADQVFTFGAPGAALKPVTGDWDGNGTTTIGLYDPATNIVYLRNTNSAGPADLSFVLQSSAGGAIPLVGAWRGVVKPSPSSAMPAVIHATAATSLPLAVQPLEVAAERGFANEQVNMVEQSLTDVVYANALRVIFTKAENQPGSLAIGRLIDSSELTSNEDAGAKSNPALIVATVAATRAKPDWLSADLADFDHVALAVEMGGDDPTELLPTAILSADLRRTDLVDQLFAGFDPR